MIRSLLVRTFRDDSWMLLGCCLLLTGLVWFRLWVVSQINFDAVLTMFAQGALPSFIEKLLPVPLKMLASIEGRVIYGYEEAPVLVPLGLWTIARGTDCLAGRMGRGTMEMLLAQPVSRTTLVATHTFVTVLGAAVIAAAAWGGTALGIATLTFDAPTTPGVYLPATLNLFALGVLLVGLATLCSALAPSRGQAAGFLVGFFLLEVTLRVLGLMSPDVAWLKWLTFLTAYDPTALTVGLVHEPELYRPLLWQYCLTLTGIGLACWTFAAVWFARRDLPAPM